DLTNDMQRALPAAIVAFARQQQFPGTAVQMVEHDVWPRDTGYIPYLTVSALALDAMVIAGILGAMATAREWERRTVKLLRLSPASPGIVLAGKLSVAATVAATALAFALVVIEVGYGVVPIARWTTAFALLACVAIFTSVGAWLGALLKRTLAAVPLLFGLAMPFYVDSGALEPTRFDGDAIWALAHLSPVYYAVGVLEWAFHGLHVTPEPIWVDLLVLVAIAVVAERAIGEQRIAAIIVVLEDFDVAAARADAAVDLYLNNVDIDLADDLRRSVTRSVAEFDAPQLGLLGELHGPSSGVLLPNPYRVAVAEHDLRDTNVSFLQYQVIPIVVLIVISVGVLGTALLTARDFEHGRAK